jgi:hypothetical protein
MDSDAGVTIRVFQRDLPDRPEPDLITGLLSHTYTKQLSGMYLPHPEYLLHQLTSVLRN